MIAGPFDDIRIPTPAEFTHYLVIAAVGAALTRIAISIYYPSHAISQFKAGLPSRDPEALLIHAAELAFNEVAKNEEILELLEMYVDPGRFTVRISEKAVLDEADYLTEVTRTIIRNHAEATSNVFVPILEPVRGTIVDNLSVTAGSAEVRTLSLRETQGALFAIGRMLLDAAFDGLDFPEALWSRLQLQILSDCPATPDDADLILGYLKSHKALIDVRNSEARSAIGMLTLFVFDMLDTMPIIAIVPMSRSCRLKYKYTESKARVPDDKVNPLIAGWEWIYSYVRAAFGLTRRSHNLRLQSATAAQSYHFHAEAPDGLYVYHLGYGFREVKVDYEATVEPPSRTSRPLNPFWNVSDTRGSNYIHAYGRDLDIASVSAQSNIQSRIPFLRIEFREKPPGLMLVVVLLSIFLTGLAVVVGHWHDTVFGISLDSVCYDRYKDYVQCLSKSNDNKSYWPTVLFGVPAIISGWLVARFTAEAVSRLSVSTLLVASWCILNSTVAMVLAALELAVLLAEHRKIWVFEWIQPLWSLLIVSTSSATMMAIMLLILRVRRYRRRIAGTLRKVD
ncbi:hypothetical protein FHT44_003547 [Mycolicibacterium sp. BK634]|uniref:hypothetical protein n=1 Tax=Mycolicibacterium sp. BK634 TaxID=2587099 RepID=UPI00161CADF8|nr:hypothetical protein [Mycolicibacterium sp. BK634]MBB3751052.1 hypothetical protein [Mycolicibacterium sp. BK634]